MKQVRHTVKQVKKIMKPVEHISHVGLPVPHPGQRVSEAKPFLHSAFLGP